MLTTRSTMISTLENHEENVPITEVYSAPS